MDLFPIRYENQKVSPQVLKQIGLVSKQGAFILSKYVSAFERDFADVLRASYAVGVNSGTDALTLALKALGIKEGDEVIVPAFTFISTAFAPVYLGAKPVFADVDPDTFNILPQEILRLANKKTKAVICVHLFGNSCDMDGIMRNAKEKGLYVIEDTAQAHMGIHISENGKDSFLGTIGDIGAFSFYPTKNLGAWGDAGMALTNFNGIYKRLLSIRDLGREKLRYVHKEAGLNTRLDALQAVVLNEKLKLLPFWTEKRRKIADKYKDAFYGRVKVQQEPPYSISAYHSFAAVPKSRERLIKALKKNEIPFAIYYPMALPDQPVFKKEHQKARCPNARYLAKRIVNIPIHPFLKNKEVEKVIEVVIDNA